MSKFASLGFTGSSSSILSRSASRSTRQQRMPIRTLSTSTSTSTSSSHTLSNYAAGATATLLTFAGLGYLFNPNKEEISLQSATQIQKSNLPNISHLNPSSLTDSSLPMRQRMEIYIKLLQHSIVSKLSLEEPSPSSGGGEFFIDSWIRSQGGEGISCVLQNGQTFDKAGVNISIVHGNLPGNAIRQMSADHDGLMGRTGYKLGIKGTVKSGDEDSVESLPFYAAGLSLVVHPKNPFVPTVHFNYRYFELNHPKTLNDGSENPKYLQALEEAKEKGLKEPEPITWWFGGGTDLTPIYLNLNDAKHFHQTLKNSADLNDSAFYPAWKSWCDSYFWIPHRAESRGIGGIFFDDLFIPKNQFGISDDGEFSKKYGSFIPLSDGTKSSILSSNRPHTPETLFKTIQSMGNSFIPAYLPLVQSHKNDVYNQENQRWQEIRRGRYVEFNLVYDRGTKFGLQTPGARIESILMSLPLKARWEYMERFSGGGVDPLTGQGNKKEGGKESELMKVLRKPVNWAT